MGDLKEKIKVSIENPNGDLWFPELTASLAARAWDGLYRDIGVTRDTYGTDRVLLRRLSAPRQVITCLETCRSACATASAISVEGLSSECVSQYQKQSVCFYSLGEILNTSVLSCIEDAMVIINQVPSLMRTVANLVRSLHLIKPEREDYDVSFSEPQVPFSIFVSVPEKRISNDALRVAESIVHEVMHLQLTLIESVQTLVNRKGGEYFSPWRQEQRNAQGLLHGLYVFRVVAEFLRELNVSDCSELDHVSGRRSEIAAEINQIRLFSDCSELTSMGSAFVGRLLDSPVMNFG